MQTSMKSYIDHVFKPLDFYVKLILCANVDYNFMGIGPK